MESGGDTVQPITSYKTQPTGIPGAGRVRVGLEDVLGEWWSLTPLIHQYDPCRSQKGAGMENWLENLLT